MSQEALSTKHHGDAHQPGAPASATPLESAQYGDLSWSQRMSAYDPEENTGMLSGRSNPKPVMVGRAPQWFYAGVLILGIIGLALMGGESAGLMITTEPPVFAAITVDVNTGGGVGGAAAADDEPDFREMFTKKVTSCHLPGVTC